MNEITTMNASLEEDLAAYHRAGFPAVEIALWKIRDYLQRHTMAELKQLLQEYVIRPISACSKKAAYQCFGDEKSKQESLQAIEEDFMLMHELECRIYIMGSNVPPQWTLATYDEYAAHLRDLADIARMYRVQLAMEFNYCKIVNSVQTVTDILRKVNHPGLGFVFDTCHFYKSPSKLEDIRLLKQEDIALVHVTDLERMPVELMTDMNRVIPGDGIIPLADYFRAIAETGYAGYYSVEIFNQALWAESPDSVSKKIFERMQAY